jgi:hypothetical protein
LDAVEDMIDDIELGDRCDDMRRSAQKAVDGHRHSFLHRFLEHTENVISDREKDKELFRMPVGLKMRKRDSDIVQKEESKIQLTRVEPARVVDQPKSILKQSKAERKQSPVTV